LRVYYRRKGKPKVRLWETPGSAEFASELEKAKQTIELAQPSNDIDGAAGTLRRLCIEYIGSPAFKILDAQTTQVVRRGILESICLSQLPNGAQRGRLPYARMEPNHIEQIRDEKIDLPAAADGRVKALRQLFKWAVKTKRMRTNPAAEVEYVGGGGDGHHTWTITEVAAFHKRHPVGTMARLAIDLMLFTGVRRSDAVRLGPPMNQDGWLHFTEWKGARTRVKRRGVGEGPKHRELPILPILQASIDATPSGVDTYLVTNFGKPFGSNGFGNRMKKWCREAGLPEECTAHGLRKAGATIAAENGATEHQLMAIFGWASARQAAIYTRKANRTRLAADAMHLLMPKGTERGR
jgi:integrase